LLAVDFEELDLTEKEMKFKLFGLRKNIVTFEEK